MAYHKTKKDIQDIFASASMKRLTGWQDVKQQRNFIIRIVYYYEV